MSSPRLENIGAVYFDLDDTLCAYWDASKAALRIAFTEHGPEGYTPEQMIRQWAGVFRDFSLQVKSVWYETYLRTGEPTRTEQMRLTLNSLGIVDDDRARRLSETYARERDAHLRLFEDAEMVLTELGARFPLGLITNGPADIQRQEVETLGIGHHFRHILIEGEMGRGKPYMQVFRHAESLVGMPPERILMVGNSYSHDIVPAIEAGWRTAWIRRPSDVPPSADGTQRGPETRPPDGPIPDAEIGELCELLLLC